MIGRELGERLWEKRWGWRQPCEGRRWFRSKAPYSHIPIITSRNDLVVTEREAGHCTTMSEKRRCAIACISFPDLEIE
jgi:hypothetical protein